jgi:hypothetical protein
MPLIKSDPVPLAKRFEDASYKATSQIRVNSTKQPFSRDRAQAKSSLDKITNIQKKSQSPTTLSREQKSLLSNPSQEFVFNSNSTRLDIDEPPRIYLTRDALDSTGALINQNFGNIINSATNLRNFKFINGGASFPRKTLFNSQPFITRQIPSDFNQSLPSIYTAKSPDFILRNGFLAPINALEDVLRLTKWATTPRGLLFLLKQNILSKTGVKPEYTGFGVKTPLLNLHSGLYLTTSTIAQAGVGFFGYHLNKQGLNPFAKTGNLKDKDLYYATAVAKNTGDTGEQISNPSFAPQNRLLALYKYKIANKPVPLSPLDNINSISDKPNELISYKGGPGSFLGLFGKTEYHKSVDTNKDNNSTKLPLFNNNVGYLSSITFTQNLLFNINNSGNHGTNTIVYGHAPIQTFFDFRKTIKDKYTPPPSFLPFTDYNKFNRIETFKFGNPSANNLDRSSPYTNSKYNGKYPSADQINLLRLIEDSSIDDLVTNDDITISDVTKLNIIKFAISIVNNDDPSRRDWIFFRAYIDSFSDSYTADWNSYNYVNRAESMYRYKGFGRSISLTFKIAAQSRAELLPLYKKLNRLASSIAPDYSENGFMRGNLIYLTIGDWLTDTPGILNGMTLTITEGIPWEIARDDKGDKQNDILQLPHIIEISGFEFIPIHNFVPKYKEYFISNKTDFKDAESQAKNSEPKKFLSLPSPLRPQSDEPTLDRAVESISGDRVISALSV